MSDSHVHFGAFAGLNTRRDTRLLQPGELQSAEDVVFKGGAVTPRPGLVPIDEAALTEYAVEWSATSANRITAMHVDYTASPARIVYALTDETAGTSTLVYARIYNNGTLYTPVNYATSLPAITGIHVYRATGNNKVWMSHADSTISYYDITTPGVTTFASTGSVVPAGLWYVAAESRVYYIAADDSPASLRGVWCVTAGGTPVQLTAEDAYPLLSGVQVHRDDTIGTTLMTGALDGTVYGVYTVTASSTTATISTALHTALSGGSYVCPSLNNSTTDSRRFFVEAPSVGGLAGKSRVQGTHYGVSGDTRTMYHFLPSIEATAGVYHATTGQFFIGARLSATTVGITRLHVSALSLPIASWRLNGVIESGTAAGMPVPTSIELIQNMNLSAGGSTASAYMQYFNSSGVDQSALVPLPAGFTDYPIWAGGDYSWAPSVFHMIDRDDDVSSDSAPILPTGNYGRFSTAYAGGGVTTNQGGFLLAGGTGGYVFNYSVPEEAANTQFTLHMSYVAAPTGGTFKVFFAGEESGVCAFNTTAAAFQTVLESMACFAPGDINVTGGPFPDTDITVELLDHYEDTKCPPFTMSDNSLTGGKLAAVECTSYTPGRSAPQGMLWLYPAGLPYPNGPSDAAGRNVFFTPTVEDGADDADYSICGVYTYVVTLYSSVLQLESPPSEETHQMEIGSPGVPTPAYAKITWTIPAATSTLWFNDVFGKRDGLSYAALSPSVPIGPVIDKVRIYRKRWGYMSTGSGTADGIGAFMDYRFVAEVPINNRADLEPNGGGYIDNLSDADLQPATQPSEKWYPPDDAQYVSVINDHSYWVGGTAGTRTIWYSRGTIVGGIDDGEYGSCYVSPYNYVLLSDIQARGTGITALRGFNGYLMAWTEDSLHMGDVSAVDDYGPAFTVIDGVAGCASHWAIAQTESLPDYAGGLLLYAHPRGGIYAFDGTKSSSVGTDALLGDLPSWSKLISAFPTSLKPQRAPASWYWAWAGFDPSLRILLFSVPLDSGAFRTYAYSLDDRAWSRWSSPIYGAAVLPDSSAPATPSEVRFRDSLLVSQGGNLARLMEGYCDGALPFDWSIRTGDIPLSAQLEIRKLLDGVVLVDHKGTSAGASDTELSVSAHIGGTEYPLTAVETGPGEVAFSVNQRARYMSLEFSGSKTANVSSPYIVGYGVQSQAAGMRMRNDVTA